MNNHQIKTIERKNESIKRKTIKRKTINQKIRKLRLLLIKIALIIILIIMLYLEIITKKNKINFFTFEKYKLNPVLGDIKTGTVFDPCVIEDKNGFYRMYVSWRKLGKIAVSLSPDGINWSNMQIVMGKSNSNNWAYNINRASVIFKDGIYKMWFTGQNNKKSKIGYAFSEDGYNFTRLDNPILIPEYNYEKTNVMNPHVLYDKEEKIYKMYYAAGEFYEPDVICYATSKDGIIWEKYKNNPILIPNNNKTLLDSFKLGGCDVHKISSNYYLMFYIGYPDIDHARIFFAESKDGITNWKRSNNPIIEPTKNSFDSDACYKPSAIYNKKDKLWMLYYNGRKKSNEYIGLATYKN